MRRTVASFGIASVDLISSTRGPLRITSKPLEVAMQLMGLMALKKRKSLHLKENRIDNID